MNYCAVCGKFHAEIADCSKYGVHICSAHCNICEYRLNKDGNFSLMLCGYNSTARALKIPLYIASDSEIAAECVQMENWKPEEIAERHERLKVFYRETAEPSLKAKFRVQLAATQKLLRDRADDVIAEAHIPTMKTEQILEYRKELCRHIAENTGTARLQRAVRRALELCKAELERREIA